MGMTAIQVIGDIAASHGYRVIIDSTTTAGKIYFGFAKSGAKKSDAAWFILCLDRTVSGIQDFEWANGGGYI